MIIRRRSLMPLVLFAVSSCSATVGTEPLGTFPVTLTSGTFSPPQVPSGTITGAGDSVTAVIVVPATCGRTLSAAAGTAQSNFTLTVISTSNGVQTCDPINGSTVYQATARHVPAGTYNARADYRLVSSAGAVDTIMVTKMITLP